MMTKGPFNKIAKDKVHLSRKNIRKVLGLLTGHCALRKYLKGTAS